MPIDDPIDAAETIIASDQRLQGALDNYLQGFSGLVPDPIAQTVSRFLAWQSDKRRERTEYLLQVLTGEFRKLRTQVEQFTTEHKTFFAEDFRPLVAEGMKRAENLRAKSRVERIGKILAHAAQHGPAITADDTEELMRIAMDLTDKDVLVLDEIYRKQHEGVEKSAVGMPSIDEVNTWLHRHPLDVPGVSNSERFSILPKLQSFGLIVQVERRPMKLAPNEIPYALLRKGYDFVNYIKGVTAE